MPMLDLVVLWVSPERLGRPGKALPKAPGMLTVLWVSVSAVLYSLPMNRNS